MASKAVIPRVKDEATDRAVQSLSQLISKSLLADGVLVEDFKLRSNSPPKVPHGLGRKAKGALIVGADKGVFYASVAGGTSKVANLAISPQWELLEHRKINNASQNFDFAHVLASDDYEISINGIWKASAAGNGLRYRINGAISSSLSNCHSAYHSARTGTGATASGILCGVQQSAVTGEHMITSSMTVATGENRLTQAVDNMTDGTAAANTTQWTMGGKWEDTTTPIVGVGVDATGASHLVAGSNFSLYRRPRLDGRTLNIWIF